MFLGEIHGRNFSEAEDESSLASLREIVDKVFVSLCSVQSEREDFGVGSLCVEVDLLVSEVLDQDAHLSSLAAELERLEDFVHFVEVLAFLLAVDLENDRLVRFFFDPDYF